MKFGEDLKIFEQCFGTRGDPQNEVWRSSKDWSMDVSRVPLYYISR